MTRSLTYPASAILSVLAALTLGTASAAGQAITVRGRVIERGTDEAIAGATAELSGVGRTITNPRGEFFFSLPRAGRQNLTVTMFGYRRHTSSIAVRADTTLLIELEIEAIRIEEITVRKRTYTLRGEVTQNADRQPVVDADILISKDKRVRTNLAGRFKTGGLSVGEPVTVQVSALGLMPQQLLLQPERDTTVKVTMAPDPIGLRMIALQVERLENRVGAVPHSVRVLNHDELMRWSSVSAYEVVTRLLRAGQKEIPCLFIDERPAMLGVEELMSYVPDTLERIEIIDRGAMVRVYTRRFIQEMLRRRANPTAILMVRGTGRPICN